MTKQTTPPINWLKRRARKAIDLVRGRRMLVNEFNLTADAAAIMKFLAPLYDRCTLTFDTLDAWPCKNTGQQRPQPAASALELSTSRNAAHLEDTCLVCARCVPRIFEDLSF